MIWVRISLGTSPLCMTVFLSWIHWAPVLRSRRQASLTSLTKGQFLGLTWKCNVSTSFPNAVSIRAAFESRGEALPGRACPWCCTPSLSDTAQQLWGRGNFSSAGLNPRQTPPEVSEQTAPKSMEGSTVWMELWEEWVSIPSQSPPWWHSWTDEAYLLLLWCQWFLTVYSSVCLPSRWNSPSDFLNTWKQQSVDAMSNVMDVLCNMSATMCNISVKYEAHTPPCPFLSTNSQTAECGVHDPPLFVPLLMVPDAYQTIPEEPKTWKHRLLN